MSMRLIAVMALGLGFSLAGCMNASVDHEMEFKALHDAYLEKYRPLVIEKDRSWWEASTTGSDEAFKKQEELENQLVELHSNREVFSKLLSLREEDLLQDPLLRRQLDVMYRQFLPGQGDPDLQKKIISLQTEIEKTFNAHRSPIGEKELTENEIREILANSKNLAEVEAAWKGYMEVGVKVNEKLLEAVRLRNELARQLRFPNYYSMQLELQEIDEEELFRLFDELDELTRAPFAELKVEIDARRAKHFGINTRELRPWHFGDLFFQDAPQMGGADLNQVYSGRDLLALTKTYYAGLGMEVEDILERSDLYEKEGKSPHAFAVDIDRKGDIRVLCNLKPNLYWMDTLIHELGHAVYDKYIDPDLPFILRTASHSITTEGYAMMLGAVAKNREYLTKVVKLPPQEVEKYVQAAQRTLRAEKLIFSRWAQVMVRFEHGMYSDPDQDLGQLWWDLKKEYQLLAPPEDLHRPDYAAKIHVAIVPVYYHGYMMGDLFASQVHHRIAKEIVGVDDIGSTGFVDSPAAGDFMKREIFEPGNRLAWNDLTLQATGEPLTAKYFVTQYVEH